MAGKKNLKFTGERLINGTEGFIKLEHLHRYALAMELVENKIVLDIACGEGYGSNLMAEKAKEIFAMDIDNTIVDHAAFTYKKRNLKFLTGDIRNTSFPDHTFDVIVCFETIEHVDEHHIVMTEFKRILKPQGVILMSTPEKANYSIASNHVNPFHKKELTFVEYNDLLSKYFKFNQFQFQFPVVGTFIVNPEMPEFKYYTGTYSKIDLDVPPFNQFIISISSDIMFQMPESSVFYERDVKNFLFNVSQNRLEIKLAKLILKPIRFVNKLRKWIYK